MVSPLLKKIAGVGVLGLSLVGAGFANAGTRVVGGHHAAEGAWPYQAFVTIEKQPGKYSMCGGTLIDQHWVLTAAHCVADKTTPLAAKSFMIRLGSNNRSEGGQIFAVTKVVMHAQYSQRKLFENDIALLKLERAASFEVAKLDGLTASRAQLENRARRPWATVIGWGRITGTGRETSQRLMQASMPLVSTQTCNTYMGGGSVGSIDNRQLCAGMTAGGVDSCNGDSGGPLLVKSGGNWVQIGLVSWGSPKCGEPNKYGVYTRISAYRDWIAKNTGMKAAGAATPSNSGSQMSQNPVTGDTLDMGTVASVLPSGDALGPFSGADGLLAAAAANDGRVSIDIVPGARMKVGDEFKISIKSSFDGYLLLFDIAEDGKVTQLFPNPRSADVNADGRILAGSVLTMPDASYGFSFSAAEPLGRGRLLAVVAKNASAFGSFSRASEGFEDLPSGGLDRLARLEIVLKNPASGATTSQDWAAAQIDYIVEK